MAAQRTTDKDGNKSWETYDKSGNKQTEGRINADGSRENRTYKDGKLASERITDSAGNESWKSYKEDGSVQNHGHRNVDGSGSATIDGRTRSWGPDNK